MQRHERKLKVLFKTVTKVKITPAVTVALYFNLLRTHPYSKLNRNHAQFFKQHFASTRLCTARHPIPSGQRDKHNTRSVKMASTILVAIFDLLCSRRASALNFCKTQTTETLGLGNPTTSCQATAFHSASICGCKFIDKWS